MQWYRASQGGLNVTDASGNTSATAIPNTYPNQQIDSPAPIALQLQVILI
jgi:hypothetical protein